MLAQAFPGGIWCLDFEYRQPPGERPAPHTFIAHNVLTGQWIELYGEALWRQRTPPCPISQDALSVFYYGTGDLQCFRALGWTCPRYVLDLFTEFRCVTNGRATPAGASLLGALIYYGIPHTVDAVTKDAMRALADRDAPLDPEEIRQVLGYCRSDVTALAHLFAAMQPRFSTEAELSFALLRGRYTRAVAAIEWAGIPLDVPVLTRLRGAWDGIKDLLIDRVPGARELYEGTHFRSARFAAWLEAQGLPWPRLPSSALELKDDTFRAQAKLYPVVAPIRELRHALSDLRLGDLEVGADGRNRTLSSMFRPVSGRNQPSNTKFVFGPSVWLRGLTQPAPDHGVAYIDWNSQEFAVAAALSKDPIMHQCYVSGDPYLEFAKRAGAVPLEATRASHPELRDRYKVVILATGYGAGPDRQATQLGCSRREAQQLLTTHRRIFSRFWAWSDGVVEMMHVQRELRTCFGWRLQPGTETSSRRFRNFPAQAHGSEMLRLAACLLTEAGLPVIATVHDAVLLEGPIDQLSTLVAETRRLMEAAARTVLDGFPATTSVSLTLAPDRYMDPRGMVMWKTVMATLDEWEQRKREPGQMSTLGEISPRGVAETLPPGNVVVVESKSSEVVLIGVRTNNGKNVIHRVHGSSDA
jgi:hypothetical protein